MQATPTRSQRGRMKDLPSFGETALSIVPLTRHWQNAKPSNLALSRLHLYCDASPLTSAVDTKTPAIRRWPPNSTPRENAPYGFASRTSRTESSSATPFVARDWGGPKTSPKSPRIDSQRSAGTPPSATVLKLAALET